MIDFRYHLVSIVAVFLALAIGIVVGSTALKPAVLTGLQKTASAEKGRIDALFAKNAQLNNQLKAAESYAQSGEHLALGGLLDGQRVVLVTAPGFPGSVVTGVSSALTLAGATLSGEVALQSQFFTAGTQSDLDTLNRQQTPAGVTLRNGTQQAQAAELIASAILTKNGPTQPPAGGRRHRQSDPQRLRGWRFPEYQREPGGSCHPGCRDNPGRPARDQQLQQREPDSRDRGAAAEPGRRRHGRGRAAQRVRTGQRHRRDALRRAV
jgi:hypothetical protein